MFCTYAVVASLVLLSPLDWVVPTVPDASVLLDRVSLPNKVATVPELDTKVPAVSTPVLGV